MTPGRPNTSRLRYLTPSPAPTGPRRLRRELAAREKQLAESIAGLDALTWQLDRYRDGTFGWLGGTGGGWGFPQDRAQDKTHAPTAYETEDSLFAQIAIARDLVQRNHLALAARDLVCDFVGPVSVTFVLRDGPPGPSAAATHPEVKLANAMWHRWCEFVEWGCGEEDTERECLQRLVTEGECTLRFWEGDDDSDGLPHVRIIDPEFIRTPPGASVSDPWGWGVKTRPNDHAGPEDGLYVTNSGQAADGAALERSEYARIKGNVDRVIKRGVGDFFPCAALFDKVLGLRENLAHNGKVLAALLWWEQYPTATEAQVTSMIQAGRDYSRPKLTPNDSQRRIDVEGLEAGSIVRTEAGRVVVAPPAAVNTTNLLAIDAAVIKGLGYRFGFPAYFSGESDASFASVLVTGTPFVRRIGFRQQRAEAFSAKVATRFLQFCERSGRLPAGISQRLKPVTETESIIVADEEKKSRVFLAEYAAGVASPQAYIRSTGEDPEQVLADIAQWKKQNPPDGQQGGQQGPPPAGGPTDPTPAPPGSAGGDGSSPNADPLAGLQGEGETGDGVQEEATSAALDALGVPTSEGRADLFGTLVTEAGFTGKDKHGHHWVNGKQVKAPTTGAGAKPPASGGAAPNPHPGGLVNLRDVIQKQHAGDATKAGAAVAARVAGHLAAGGKVTAYFDGKAIPITSADGGVLRDAKGQAWGTTALAMARTDMRHGLEFHPVAKPAAKPPVKVDKPGAAPKPTPADDEAARVAWEQVPPAKKAAAVERVKVKADSPEGKAVLAKAEQWADAQAAKHAAKYAAHMGISEASARYVLASTIKMLCRKALEGDTGSASQEYTGASGKKIKIGVNRKALEGTDADHSGEPLLSEGAPGPAPRPGLVWNDGTHRWRNPETGEEHEHAPAQLQSVASAVEKLGAAPNAPATPQQVDQWAQNLWFNSTAAQKEFKGHKAFARAVVAAKFPEDAKAVVRIAAPAPEGHLTTNTDPEAEPFTGKDGKPLLVDGKPIKSGDVLMVKEPNDKFAKPVLVGAAWPEWASGSAADAPGVKIKPQRVSGINVGEFWGAFARTATPEDLRQYAAVSGKPLPDDFKGALLRGDHPPTLPATESRVARESRREGEVWQTNGRWYTLKGGRTVRAKAPGGEKADAEPAETAKQPHEMTRAEWKKVEKGPPIPAGYTRLYRGQSVGEGGPWFSTELEVADDYAADRAIGDKKPAEISYVDVPKGAASEYANAAIAKNAELETTGYEGESAHYLPAGVAAKAKRLKPPGTHGQMVEDAIKAGKPVPPEVLKDYPDLAPKSSAPAAVTPDQLAAERPNDAPAWASGTDGAESPYEPDHTSLDRVMGKREFVEKRVAALLKAAGPAGIKIPLLVKQINKGGTAYGDVTPQHIAAVLQGLEVDHDGEMVRLTPAGPAPAVSPEQLAADPGADRRTLETLRDQHPADSKAYDFLDTALYNLAPDTRDLSGPDRRRQTADRLGSMYAEAHDGGDAETAGAVTAALAHFGASLHGPDEGEPAAFDGRYYESEHSVFTGDPVTVLRRPVVLPDGEGGEYVAVKGKAGPARRVESTGTVESLAALLEGLDPEGEAVSEAARVARKDGDTWQVGDNWYTKKGGKIRKAADPGKQKPPTKKAQARAARDTHADHAQKVTAAAAKLADGGDGLTHDDVLHLDAHLEKLTVPKLKEVARAIGAKLSGAKKELAQRLIEQAKAMVAGKGGQPKTAPPAPIAPVAKPAPPPAAKPAPAKPTAKPTTKPVAAPKPSAKTPAAPTVTKDAKGERTTTFPAGVPERAAAEYGADIKRAMRELRLDREYEDGPTPIGAIADELRQTRPEATDGDILAALSHMRKTRQLEGQPLNEVQKLDDPKSGARPLAGGTDAATLWDKGRAVHYFLLPRAAK